MKGFLEFIREQGVKKLILNRGYLSIIKIVGKTKISTACFFHRGGFVLLDCGQGVPT